MKIETKPFEESVGNLDILCQNDMATHRAAEDEAIAVAALGNSVGHRTRIDFATIPIDKNAIRYDFEI